MNAYLIILCKLEDDGNHLLTFNIILLVTCPNSDISHPVTVRNKAALSV